MNLSEQIRLHVDTATDAADGCKRMTDFRAQYVHLWIASVHSAAALALSIDRFAAAVEPKEQP